MWRPSWRRQVYLVGPPHHKNHTIVVLVMECSVTKEHILSPKNAMYTLEFDSETSCIASQRLFDGV
jgi:hypothetical protein